MTTATALEWMDATEFADRPTPRDLQEFFGTALWIGFTAHLIGAEVWINYKESASVAERGT